MEQKVESQKAKLVVELILSDIFGDAWQGWFNTRPEALSELKLKVALNQYL